MTYAEIASMIESTELENTYYQYPEGEAPELPYILFYYPYLAVPLLFRYRVIIQLCDLI